MYLTFHGLTERPFNNTPDPRFLHLTRDQREALAQLVYCVKEQTGFMVLTGEIGTGKTTLLRALLRQLDTGAAVAFVFNSTLPFDGILEYMLEDFGIAKPGDSRAQRLFALNHFLIERRRMGQGAAAHHRRGPEPERGDSRAGSASLEFRDPDAQAIADHPRRPARTRVDPETPRAPPAAPADRTPNQDHPARPWRGRRVHPHAASRGGSPRSGYLHGARRLANRASLGWHPTCRQQSLRPLSHHRLRVSDSTRRARDCGGSGSGHRRLGNPSPQNVPRAIRRRAKASRGRVVLVPTLVAAAIVVTTATAVPYITPYFSAIAQAALAVFGR